MWVLYLQSQRLWQIPGQAMERGPLSPSLYQPHTASRSHWCWGYPNWSALGGGSWSYWCWGYPHWSILGGGMLSAGDWEHHSR